VISFMEWTVDDVCSWIVRSDLADACAKFTENDIDGKTLDGLTESMVGQLLPTMKLQVKFLAMLKAVRAGDYGSTPEFEVQRHQLQQQYNGQQQLSLPSAQNGAQLYFVTYALPTFPPAVVRSLDIGQRQSFHMAMCNRVQLVSCLFHDLISRNI
jgi:hypothetical protein